MAGLNLKAHVRYTGDGMFIGVSPGGHAQAIETNSARGNAVSPVEMLLLALGGCTGIDVVGILEKKRIKVTDYRVEVSGDRREEHPRKFEKISVHHVLRGVGLTDKAVAQAIELSDTKYCSVAASLRPGAEIVSSYEIIDEGASPGQ